MSAQPEKRQGKKRKQNFTSAECSLLVDLVEKNLGTLRGQFSSTITNAKKQQLWETIASKINSLGYEKRTPAEVREKWRNMAQVAKKTNSGLLKSQRKTGGGPAEKPPTSTTAKIISLLGDEPSFSADTSDNRDNTHSTLSHYDSDHEDYHDLYDDVDEGSGKTDKVPVSMIGDNGNKTGSSGSSIEAPIIIDDPRGKTGINHQGSALRRKARCVLMCKRCILQF
ncbi:myb SANT-like DNA-binding domain-containing 4 [Paramuricea clavata]|uniref:Myb SANT-like DNA-binding domain-containing 4 n=1 Tax=Paramuricea clavata TaxID=317549 RepID=A0A6S7FPE3_PARCT|nr:myb SANT-like DNA-binding domain-containing 4 [Paramuricea clavata]